MGRWYFHSTEAVWEMIAWEEWLGCWYDASPMFNIPGSTPVWAEYIFSGFSRYKNLYVLCFQSYTYYKITLVGSDLILARWGSENVFRLPISFKRDFNHKRVYLYMCFIVNEFYTYKSYYVSFNGFMDNTPC